MVQNRQQRGVPTGGQFTSHQHAEADITISDPVPAPFTREDAERIAIAQGNVAAVASFDECPGEIIADPAGLEPGDIVWVRGHGKFRKAVVHKVGRKNATAVFTTPGAIAETERMKDHAIAAYHDREKHAEQAGALAGKNYDFGVRRTDPTDKSYTDWPRVYTPEKIAAEVEKAKKDLAEHGTREEAIERARQLRMDSLVKGFEEATTLDLADRVLFTNATVKPGESKLDPTSAH